MTPRRKPNAEMFNTRISMYLCNMSSKAVHLCQSVTPFESCAGSLVSEHAQGRSSEQERDWLVESMLTYYDQSGERVLQRLRIHLLRLSTKANEADLTPIG